MKILLMDVDKTGFPNLALMKLSAWHKQKGDTVYLNRCYTPDKLYMSCVFTWNKPKEIIDNCEIEGGGSGIDVNIRLPDEIEAIMPDYSLYNLDYSIGFITRGCIRNCSFCIVPKKEGKIKQVADLKDFIHPNHDKVILLDNNLLALDTCSDILKELIQRKLKVNFCQGLDIRLIDRSNAALLSKVKYSNRKFSRKFLYFAWDNLSIENKVMEGIKILQSAGIKSMIFYILCGFETTIHDDIYRFIKLCKAGVDPYVQVFNNRKDRRSLRLFAKFVNKRCYRRNGDLEQQIYDFKPYKNTPTIGELIELEGGA